MNLTHIYAPPSLITQDEYADGFNLSVSVLETASAVPAGVVASDLSVARHFYFPQGTYPSPSASVAAAAGTGASVTQLPGYPVDSLMPLSLVTGTGPSAGILINVAYGHPFPTASIGFSFSYETTNTKALQLYVTNIATSGYSIGCATAPSVSTTYKFAIQGVGLF